MEIAVVDSADYTMVRLRRIHEPDRNYALVTVRDAGPGFAPGDEARIFQPFFTKRPGGTGLGLSIVKQTIEEHGGTISVANHPEGGAQVSVRLPLTH